MDYLVRDLRVRVIDVSGCGVRVETRRPLEVGTIGRLRATLGAEECEDDVEVIRCMAVEGTGVYHVGVRLLWTTPAQPGSIRHAVARHVADRRAAQIPCDVAG
jgi:hypothetical protein